MHIAEVVWGEPPLLPVHPLRERFYPGITLRTFGITISAEQYSDENKHINIAGVSPFRFMLNMRKYL